MRKKTFILVFAMIIFVGLFSGAQAESHCGDDCPPPEPLKYKLYFPLVPKSAPRWGYLSYGYGSEDEIIPGAVLRAPILWDWVETERGIYNWDRVDSIMALDRNGIIYANVWTTPAWARPIGPSGEPDEKSCVPPAPEHRESLAGFFRAVLNRYPEIDIIGYGNEPDINYEDGAWWAGCYGNDEIGGALYAEDVAYLSQALSGYGLPFVAGELLLHCGDYTAPCGSPFWDGAIAAGIADYINFASFHYYGKSIDDTWGSVNTVYPNKIEYMRSVTPAHIPLINTETAVLRYTEDITDPDFEALQVTFFDFVSSYHREDGIEFSIWFTLGGNGWWDTDLISGGIKRPVWYRMYDKLNPPPWWIFSE